MPNWHASVHRKQNRLVRSFVPNHHCVRLNSRKRQLGCRCSLLWLAAAQSIKKTCPETLVICFRSSGVITVRETVPKFSSSRHANRIGQKRERLSSYLLVILSLQEIEFFFYPIARFSHCEFERLTWLRRSLKQKRKIVQLLH